MSEYGNLKQERPIRFILAVIAFRAIWWPLLAVLMPFAMIGAFVDWLSWTAFPAVARTFQPAGAAVHAGALRIGNAILGYNPKAEAHD